jgi:hypothetical protein
MLLREHYIQAQHHEVRLIFAAHTNLPLKPEKKTSVKLLQFMESCEATGDFDAAAMSVPCKASKDNKGSPPDDPKKQKWCKNHGWSSHVSGGSS